MLSFCFRFSKTDSLTEKRSSQCLFQPILKNLLEKGTGTLGGSRNTWREPEHSEKIGTFGGNRNTRAKSKIFDWAMTDCFYTSRLHDKNRNHDVNDERRYSPKIQHVYWNLDLIYFEYFMFHVIFFKNLGYRIQKYNKHLWRILKSIN